ncbi:uncharacterized protein LOC143367137 [Andrena cerasifolii]|uniref:uncharacterized protein LOC143367137 n=1 Tax=Andrena cerasifolii TaxID=2819439 RepID=UPI0040383A2A
MASSALEAKINKIRQQNEEIRRRHEEVEEDKKNAAKLNALVQMVPSSDWPERKEPPEFSSPPKAKQKPAKEKLEYTPLSHPNEGKKVHSFAQGEGPPPDPKYNFLADSEREEPNAEYTKETAGSRSHNKVTRGSFKKKTGGRESIPKDNKAYKGSYRDESQPGYDAWRAERNRIDEDRISRQRTAEGNWRREWDNDKMHIIDEGMKKTSRPTLVDFTKKDHKDSDRRYHANNNEHVNHTRGGSRGMHRGSSKNFYSNYENRSHNTYDQHRNNAAMPAKAPMSPTSEDRTVIATDKSIKVTVNQGNVTKGPVMSVKVNSPSIAGTGRVGPRQRTRVTYSHSDAEAPITEDESFNRQKSFEDKSKGSYYNAQKSPNIKRSHSQKKKEGDAKYPYHQRKETRREDTDMNSQIHHDSEFRSQKDSQASYATKSPRPVGGNVKATKHDSSNISSSETCERREYSNLGLTKLEDNVVKESSEISKPALSEQTDTLNTENEEFTAESVEANAENVETKIENAETNPESLNINAGSLETNTQSGETKIENVETSTENVETKMENVETKMENVETSTENVETNTQSGETKIENVETSAESVETNTNNVEANTDNVVANTQNVEANTENVVANTDNVVANTKNVVANTENVVANTQNVASNTENVVANTENVVSNTENVVANTENVVANMKNEITTEPTLPKEAVKAEETSSAYLSSTENLEPLTKDDTDKNNLDNKHECRRELANDTTEDFSEASNTSSGASVPNDTESKEELVPNDINNVSNDILKLEEASRKDDRQSSKQDSEQFVNDDCDNIKDEVATQRSAQVTADDHESSLKLETHSVIEVKDQSVCNNVSVEAEVPVTNTKADENNQYTDKDVKNAANCVEMNQENGSANVDAN